ncbi:hypothetical protein PP651_gp61 [Aeromonas phage ZPAH14]|uniref:Uncharacterized protein n=1 Tax=Aeromonas phage ZPAH14 TaxID=2924887 RepID=A0AAE9H2N8_9CAUD|nr:hypothetical protein PP651_gp61 [Aeromonas phage ZPAH14]UOT58018.1 hypothetical protein [Aeromonas phage ZPAH14]
MAKKPTIEPSNIAMLLALLDAGIDHNYHLAENEDVVIQNLHSLAVPGTPIAVVRRTYMEGRNTLLAQAANTARAMLSAKDIKIEGILMPNDVGAAELLEQASKLLQKKIEEQKAAQELAQAQEAATKPVV